MTSQCFCMNSVSGRDGCIARLCTQCPTSAAGDGMPSDSRPLLTGCHVLAAVVGAEHAGRGDRHVHPVGVVRVENDRVQAHPARAGLPLRARAVLAQAADFLPAVAAVGGAEQRRVLDSGVDGVPVGQGRLQVPDPGELPRVRRAVVPLVRARDAGVAEVLADRLPGRAAVVGALDHLAEPAGGLRGVEPVRIDRRAGDVVDLPAARSADRRRPTSAAARQRSARTHPCGCRPELARQPSLEPMT